MFLILIAMIITDTGSKLNVEADKITVSTVYEGDFQEFIPVSGTVLPKNTYYLDAILGGIVEQKYIEEGTMVKKGDKILKLSNPNLQLSALQNEAATYQQINEARNTRLQIEQNSIALQTQLVDANFNFINSKQLFTREKIMWEKKLVSQQEFEQMRDKYFHDEEQYRLTRQNFVQDSILKHSQLTQITSAIDRLQKNLELIRENIENLTVRAPISGQLTALNAETGQSKSPGDQLGQIDAMDGFKVRADIDEFYIARVVKGLHATVDIDGKDFKLLCQKASDSDASGIMVS